MTTLEIIKKELPECIWRRMIKYPFIGGVDPAYYQVYELFDVIGWNETEELFKFWNDLYLLYFDYQRGTPPVEKVEAVFNKHGIPLEVPKVLYVFSFRCEGHSCPRCGRGCICQGTERNCAHCIPLEATEREA